MIKVFCDRCGHSFETIALAQHSPSDAISIINESSFKVKEKVFLLCPECQKEICEFITNYTDWATQAGKALKEISSRLSYEDEDKNKNEDNESEEEKDNHFYKINCKTPGHLIFGPDNASWDCSLLEPSQPLKEAPSLEELLKKLEKTVSKTIEDMPADAGYGEILETAMGEVKKTGLDKEISEAFERQLNKINNDKNKKNGVF